MKLRKKNKYAVGQVIGAGMQFGEMIGGPIKQRAEQIDPNTGEYLDYNRAVRNAGAGSIWAPHKAITASLSDPNASGSEKALSFTSLLGIPGLSKMWAKKRYSRLEDENRDAAFLAQHPNVMGQSYNPYYMATGGIAGEYAELEKGEPFMTPDGQIEMVKGKTHAQGGEDFMLPRGTAILGKNDSKMFGEKFKELGARLKKAQDKHEKILNENSNPIARRSSLLMLDRIDKEYKALVDEQETAKMKSGMHRMPNGKMMSNKDMYAYGGEIDPAYITAKRSFYPRPIGGVFSDTTPIALDTSSLPTSYGDNSISVNTETKNFDINNTLSTVGQLAPILYNIGQGTFGERDNYDWRKYTNPYEGGIRSLMRNRRFNIDPILESNRISQSVYNRNLRNAGASPSQLLAGLQSGVVGRQRADASAYAQQSNVNNDYIGQQAHMDYLLGKDISGLKQYGYEANLKNRAAKRNYLSAGLTQLQQYLQMKELMKNQKTADKERLSLLDEYIPNFLYERYKGYDFVAPSNK